MKLKSNLIIGGIVFMASLAQSFAKDGLTLSVQTTNAVLIWPSTSGNIYLVENETNLNGGFPWNPLTNYFPAATGTNWTTFVHSNGVIYPPPITGGSGDTGGSGGPPSPGGTNGSGGGGTNAVLATAGFYTVYNVSPVAVPAFFSVPQDSSANQLGIFQYDTDPNNDYFYLSAVSTAAHGTMSYSLDASTFQYTPAAGFYGVDSFTYSITNLHHGTATAIVTVFVNQTGNSQPSANDVTLTLPTNVYSIAFNAITNSSSSANTLYFVTAPRYGTVSTNGSGNMTYNRNPSLFGSDHFTYYVTDGKGGYAMGNVIVQQVDTVGAGMPDQWQLAYGLDPTVDNSMGDPDGDGLPNLAEFILGTNPRMSGNPLNFPTITNGTVLSGWAQLPLVGISPLVPMPPVMLYVNGSSAANTQFAQGPDGTWWLNWDTTHVTNGSYSIQAAMQYGANSTLIFGSAKAVEVTNIMMFDQLTSQFSDYGLIINTTLAVPNASYTMHLYDDYGNPLVWTSGSKTNGTIELYWNLCNQYGQQISSGNIQAVFNLTGTNIHPGPQPITNWWYREGNAASYGFVVAWGWDNYTSQFYNYHNQMIENSVVNILANPSDPNSYSLGPCCIYNIPYSSAPTFRYDTEADKRVLTNALSQNYYFFWLGHGNPNVIAGNFDKSNIAPTEVQDAIGNHLWRSTPKHPQTNAHPYKLAILNGCQTYDDIWSRTFGIDYSEGGSTNSVLAYEYAGRSPRAFVGWTNENKVPSGLDITGVGHAEFGNALAELFSHWMGGDPLEFCLIAFDVTALDYGFTGQDSWAISGCPDLQRGQ
jgi:hypothetical protein